MTPTVTIVMYHYVRDLERTRYPEIKGLDAKKFRGQLMHIRRQLRGDYRRRLDGSVC